MQQLSASYQLAGDHYKVNYWRSGNIDADHILLCVHGLLGRSRDFDDLALSLGNNYLTIAIDLPGRGSSDWLASSDLYTPHNYLPAIHAVLEAYPFKPIHWIGTSLGGILGMAYAHEENHRLERLVLNDVGSFIPGSAIARIADYIVDPLFGSMDDVIRFFQKTYPSFRNISTEQWQRVATFGSRHTDEGIRLHYDPAIAVNTRLNQGDDIDLEPLWCSIEVPQLLIHGTASDLLTQSTVDYMCHHQPSMKLFQVEGVGHAPPLMTHNEIVEIRNWLLKEAM